jgi:hypothetical protein
MRRPTTSMTRRLAPPMRTILSGLRERFGFFRSFADMDQRNATMAGKVKRKGPLSFSGLASRERARQDAA